jgi:hypothetical protein
MLGAMQEAHSGVPSPITTLTCWPRSISCVQREDRARVRYGDLRPDLLTIYFGLFGSGNVDHAIADPRSASKEGPPYVRYVGLVLGHGGTPCG